VRVLFCDFDFILPFPSLLIIAHSSFPLVVATNVTLVSLSNNEAELAGGAKLTVAYFSLSLPLAPVPACQSIVTGGPVLHGLHGLPSAELFVCIQTEEKGGNRQRRQAPELAIDHL